MLLRNPADGQDVLDAVHQAASEATDTLVVYFAGHGMRSLDGFLYLALGHSERNRKLYKSVAFNYLRTAVLESAAPRKVVILDCCYSGAALEGYMGGPDEFADQAAIEGTYVMTASAATQAAMAPVGAHFTAFTGELVKAITDGVPDVLGPLDMNALYQHVSRELASQGMPVPLQRAGDQGHAITLFRNKWKRPRKKPTLATLREEWFRAIQEGLLWHVRDVPALAEGRLRTEFGEPGLIGSLLVARIAARLARGEGTANIRGWLAASPFSLRPAPMLMSSPSSSARSSSGSSMTGWPPPLWSSTAWDCSPGGRRARTCFSLNTGLPNEVVRCLVHVWNVNSGSCGAARTRVSTRHSRRCRPLHWRHIPTCGRG